MRKGVLSLLIVVAVLVGGTANAAIKPPFKNCTQLNKRYVHGVGKLGARDKVTSGRPVTNFFHSTALYSKAMRNNRGLDRDRDGIACEKS